MNINSLANTALLPHEAADPIANRKEGISPLHRSQTVTDIEPAQKSNRETNPDHAARGSARSQENADSDKQRKSVAGNRDKGNESLADKDKRSHSAAEIGKKTVTSTATRSDILKSTGKSETEGPQLQLLKRQLVAKRSQARQIYLNTLETKVIDNVNSGIRQTGEIDDIAEVTETLNDYAQMIKRDLTFSQQEGNTSIAIHDRGTGQLIKTISSEEAIEMSGDIDQFKTGHLLEVRA